MRSLVLQNCLVKSKRFERVRNFFEDICHLDLQLLDHNGCFVSSDDVLSSDEDFEGIHPIVVEKPVDTEVFGSSLTTVPPDIISECSRKKFPIQYLSSKGYRRFLIPIIQKDNVAGFLLSGEKEGVVFGERQVKSIMTFLQDVLKESLETDLLMYKDFEAQSRSPQRQVLNRALKYIKQNYDTPSLTLRRIAQESGVSYFHLSHLFKKELNMTFSDYLNDLRISVAMRLLRDKGLAVNQVSSICGFDDPSYFSKVFKKIQGVSPVVFRSQLAVSAGSSDPEVPAEVVF